MLPLLESDCSIHGRFLLCSTIFPLCSLDIQKPVTACKALCERVKQDCSQDPVLTILWPKFLDCNKLAQPENQELCMEAPTSNQKVDKIYSSNIRSWIPWLHDTSFKTTKSPGNCPENFTEISDTMCGPQCDRDAFFETSQKRISELWILVLSAICFLFTLSSLITFWCEPLRFGYPEKPILFLVLCYNLLSICYLERLLFHGSRKKSNYSGERLCVSSPQCLASFIGISYFSLSATSWWVIFALCWYLSSEKQWSSEALEMKSGLFHVLAWLVPLVPPLFALIWEAVNQNELTGICQSTNFILIPMFIMLSVGVVLTLLTLRSLGGLRYEMRENAFNIKLRQIKARLSLFTSIYLISTFSAIVLEYIESLEPTSVAQCEQFENICKPIKPYSAGYSMARIFFVLSSGTFAGMWVWSKKTCDSYRSKLSQRIVITSIDNRAPKKHHNKTNTNKIYASINFHKVPEIRTAV